nr:sugar MFS transporter [Paraneptunicella aestuarii]
MSSRYALISLTSLFFMWGFITAMNDILIPHLKGVFELNYTQAMLVQFCFFSAYFLISVPAGRLVEKMGYQNGIVIGLLGAAAGCILFIPSAKLETYWMFLAALFVLASGITILQVAANPLVALIGKPKTASSRLNLTQAFNSLGTTIAPIIGGLLIFGAVESSNSASADSVIIPYMALAGILVLLAFFFRSIPLPQIRHTEQKESATDTGSLWQHRHLVLGTVGIFVYVGAEVSVGSFLISFLGEDHIAGLSEAQAAHYVAYFWGGAMVGRFIGAFVMQYIAANKLLAINSLVAILLLSVAITGKGSVAMLSLLALGLCNSIMFPTIFTLAIAKLGVQTSRGSGLLCLAIVGGAIVPVMQGMLADTISIQTSLILPLLCYLFIAFYGFKGYRTSL